MNPKNSYRASKEEILMGAGGLWIAILGSSLGSAFLAGFNGHLYSFLKTEDTPYFKSKRVEYYLSNNGTEGSTDFLLPEYFGFMWIELVANFLGIVSSPILANQLGRKPAVYICNVILFVGALLQGMSYPLESYGLLVTARFLLGLNIGLAFTIVPLYLMEIAPKESRGAVVSILVLIISISSLIEGLLLCIVRMEPTSWHWLLWMPLIPACIQITCFLPLCPETPRFTLLMRGLETEAIESLQWLRGKSNIDEEWNELMAEDVTMTNSGSGVWIHKLFTNSSSRKAILINCVLQVAILTCGLSTIYFYSPWLYFRFDNPLEISDEPSEEIVWAYTKKGTLGLTVTVFLLVTSIVIDRLGRRLLLLIGLGFMSFVMIFSYLFLLFYDQSGNHYWEWVSYLSYLSALLIFVMTAVYQLALGVVPLVLSCELFGQEARAIGLSTVSMFRFILELFIWGLLRRLQESLGHHIFLMHSVLLLIFFVFVWFTLKETNGKKITEIQQKLR